MARRCTLRQNIATGYMMLLSSSRDLYKVMWAAEGAAIIWSMRQNQHDTHCDVLAHLLGKYIDIQAWAENYEAYYHKWLDADDVTIYTIGTPLVDSMRSAIKQFNKQEQHRLYYWFDVDRTELPDFQWQRSPLSDEALLELPGSFSAVNRYIAPTDFLVFPADSSL